MSRYWLEVSFATGQGLRGGFSSKRRAENARRKIAAGMEGGRFSNHSNVVEVSTDTTRLSVRSGEVVSVCVTDQHAMMDAEVNLKAEREARGLAVSDVGA